MKKIAFICDIHLDEKTPKIYGVDSKKNLELILEDVRNQEINEIIFGGDIGASSAYEWFFESLNLFQYDIIIGNHDSYANVSKYYKRGFDDMELYFSQNLEGFKFIFLDSSAKRISKKQLTWLCKEIKTELQILIFIHHPILSVKTPIDLKHPLLEREEILELLLQSKKDITIFSGHYHMNDERKLGQIRQFISPSAAFQVTKASDSIEIDASFFGYRIITFEDDNIYTENRIISGIS